VFFFCVAVSFLLFCLSRGFWFFFFFFVFLRESMSLAETAVFRLPCSVLLVSASGLTRVLSIAARLLFLDPSSVGIDRAFFSPFPSFYPVSGLPEFFL